MYIISSIHQTHLIDHNRLVANHDILDHFYVVKQKVVHAGLQVL